MTDNIKAVDFNGVKFAIDSNTVFIQMKGTTVSGTVTLTDTRDGTKYQVPTGKKATVIYISDSPFDSSSKTLDYADDQDGTTNEVQLLQGVQADNTIFITAEIPAEKYLNTTNDAGHPYELWVVEESAT